MQFLTNDCHSLLFNALSCNTASDLWVCEIPNGHPITDSFAFLRYLGSVIIWLLGQVDCHLNHYVRY
jgi:hypothetical protein